MTSAPCQIPSKLAFLEAIQKAIASGYIHWEAALVELYRKTYPSTPANSSP